MLKKNTNKAKAKQSVAYFVLICGVPFPSRSIAHAAKMSYPTLTSSHVTYMNPSSRCTQEDLYLHIPSLSPLPNQLWDMYCVFDGHGGRESVDWIETNFPDVVRSCVRDVFGNWDGLGGENENENQEENKSKERFSSMVQKAIKMSYYKADVKMSRTVKSSGSTAATALVIRYSKASTCSIYAANCGDTRITALPLTGPGPPSPLKALTTDHKPTLQSESSRVAQAGGFIMRGRVCGILAVTRAFGDYQIKQFVPCLPSQATLDIDPPFNLNLYCDGVSDVLTDEAAAEWGKDGGAKRIVNEAVREGTNDNVTAVVVNVV